MPQLAGPRRRRARCRAGMADFLATCVDRAPQHPRVRWPGSGKTTVVAALAAASPAGERVVSIEEVAELVDRARRVDPARDACRQRQATPRSISRTLLETALRLAPDRLVVGEVRGREALPLVGALSASVDGAIVAMTGEGAAPRSTASSRSRASARRWRATMRAARARRPGVRDRRPRRRGGRTASLRVLSIEEVVGCTESTFDTQVLFQFPNGNFVATGHGAAVLRRARSARDPGRPGRVSGKSFDRPNRPLVRFRT